VRTRSLVIVAALVVLLLAAAGGLYAYDSGRENRIAKGVSVDGVDLSGLEAPAARAKLRAQRLEPLNRPVVARYHDRHFTLTPKRARVGVDVDGAVHRALAASREGNLLSRSWRNLRKQSLGKDVELPVSYDKAAVARLLSRVQGKVDRPARDARVDLEKGQVTPQPSQTGRVVRTSALRRDVIDALVRFDGSRNVRVRTRVAQPKVTTEKLAKKYPAVVVVDRSHFKLSLYRNLKFKKSYRVAIGQVGLETPAGLYHVQNKAVNPAWTMPNSDWVAPEDRGKVIPGGTAENPLKARWLGIFDGAGIHGTDAISSLGTAASHGCVRMRIPDVEELYDEVPVNSPVYIA
jgi:lipoprotein-anchoring transpeptidase ErfK/SrfK